MEPWTSDEPATIGAAEVPGIASRRRDGALRKPVTNWVVRHGDDHYIRSVNGRTSAWFRGTQERHEGHIQAAGANKGVNFVDADPNLNDPIDAAYRIKYRRRVRLRPPSRHPPDVRPALLRAQRVRQLGIGTAHTPVAPTADSLTSALQHTLPPDGIVHARSIAAKLRSDGARVAARRLMTVA
jgi:hypothetical protein